jgi:hypothetical protein
MAGGLMGKLMGTIQQNIDEDNKIDKNDDDEGKKRHLNMNREFRRRYRLPRRIETEERYARSR